MRKLVTAEELGYFVGPKKKDYYLKAWKRYIDNDKKMSIKFNWAAYLGSYFWFMYRKMYFYGITGILMNMLLALSLPTIYAIILPNMISVLIGIYGNKIYYCFARRKIVKFSVREKYDENEIKSFLRKNGGTNIPILICLSLIYLTIVSVIIGNSLRVLNNGHVPSNLFVTTEDKIIETSNVFLEAAFNNDFETVKVYSFMEGQNDEFIQSSMNLINTVLGYGYGIQEAISGLPTQLYYYIEDIEVVEREYARVTYSIGSNLEEDRAYLQMTLKKVDGTWKVNYTTFLYGLLE